MHYVITNTLPKSGNEYTRGERCDAGQQSGRQRDSRNDLRVILPGSHPPFCEEDFSDFARRQNDNDLAEYLRKTLFRKVWHRPRCLRIRFAFPIADESEVSSTLQAYRNIFRKQAQESWQDFIAQLPRSLSLLSLGMLILYGSKQFRDAELEETIRHTLAEAFQVGAWVLMWTAVAGLFFGGIAAIRNYFVFRRLADMPMNVEQSPFGARPSPAGTVAGSANNEGGGNAIG